MRVHIKGRDYDVTTVAGSALLHGDWQGDEAGQRIGGPILGLGIPNGTRIEEVLSASVALMDRVAERTNA